MPLTAGTGEITIAVYNATDVDGSNVEVGTLVMDYGSGAAIGELFESRPNKAAEYDGFWAIGVKSHTQGTTTGEWVVTCQAMWEGSR
jgi:hypothetical protein